MRLVLFRNGRFSVSTLMDTTDLFGLVKIAMVLWAPAKLLSRVIILVLTNARVPINILF